jgi:isoquinoline 1-oxidoreductase beta subunit
MTTTPFGPMVSRRGLLAGAGGLSFCVALGIDGRAMVSLAEATPAAAALSAWVTIRPDGGITIFSPGAEMGQGSLTSLAAIIAEELDADWSQVTVEFTPSDASIYGYESRGSRSMAIVGSRAVRSYFDQLRLAGAQVRKVLLINAADQWGVDPASLRTEPSAVVDPASGRRLTYGEIAAFATVPAELPAVDPSELKDRSAFRIIGTSMPRVDIPAKVDGSARFAIDVHLPGMVYATSLHSPVHNGEPDRWNDAAVRRMPGVVATVALPNGVAVVADSFERALAARAALEVTWKPGAAAAGFDSEPALSHEYARVHSDPAAAVETLDVKGDAAASFAGAVRTMKADYRSDFGYHAQMEPLNAVARLTAAGDGIEVWNGTQAPDRCREEIAEAMGLGSIR